MYNRVSPLLCRSGSLLKHHDLQSCTETWQEESSDIYLDLLDRWISHSYVGKGLRHCLKAYHQRE